MRNGRVHNKEQDRYGIRVKRRALKKFYFIGFLDGYQTLRNMKCALRDGFV